MMTTPQNLRPSPTVSHRRGDSTTKKTLNRSPKCRGGHGNAKRRTTIKTTRKPTGNHRCSTQTRWPPGSPTWPELRWWRPGVWRRRLMNRMRPDWRTKCTMLSQGEYIRSLSPGGAQIKIGYIYIYIYMDEVIELLISVSYWKWRSARVAALIDGGRRSMQAKWTSIPRHGAWAYTRSCSACPFISMPTSIFHLLQLKEIAEWWCQRSELYG